MVSQMMGSWTSHPVPPVAGTNVSRVGCVVGWRRRQCSSGVPVLQLEARVRHVLEVWPHLTSARQMHPEDRRSGIGDASLCAAAACSVEPRRLRL